MSQQPNNPTHHHFALFKPYGYLSQFVTRQTKRKNKKLLGELHDFPEGTMAIGRLDEDSEGLLLLTTDGKMSAHVRSRRVEKEYYVQVDGIVTDEALLKLQVGVLISINGKQYQTLSARVARLDPTPELPPRARPIRSDRHGPTSWLSLTITEGKFRQVRKMTAVVGFPTLRLVRMRIGAVHLDDLQPGEVKELEERILRT